MESESSSNGTTENIAYYGTAESNTSGDVKRRVLDRCSNFRDLNLELCLDNMFH